MSDKLEAAIKAVVDAAPPLTQEQRARLRALLSTPTPRERSTIAGIAADISWSRTPDRAARTAPARKALEDRFLELVPAEVTDPDARLAAAENLRRAHYRQLARRSAQVRKAKAIIRSAGAS